MFNIDDNTIIELLERALEDTTLDNVMVNIANMCLEALKGENIEDKQRARAMVKPIIAKYIDLTSQRKVDYKEHDNNELKERALKCAKKIEFYLDTKDLYPDIAEGLKTILSVITSDSSSLQEIHDACLLY